MNILLIAATPFEVAPALQWIRQENRTSICPVISGVGLTATAWALARALAQTDVELVINAGIAGALDPELRHGDVVHVWTERFADLGAEEADGNFSDLFALGLLDPHQAPFRNGRMENQAAESARFLPNVHGISVNKVHGYGPSIEALRRQYPDAQVESMEGAAVFYACLMAEIPFLELRSISNYVEPRNRDNWEVTLAVESLNHVLIDMLAELSGD